jgi:hypothetical protein
MRLSRCAVVKSAAKNTHPAVYWKGIIEEQGFVTREGGLLEMIMPNFPKVFKISGSSILNTRI